MAGGGTDEDKDTYMINEGIRWYNENKENLEDLDYLLNWEDENPELWIY